MSRVAVTGGSGKLGRAVVAVLVEHGYDVVNLDRTHAESAAASVRVDLTDYGQTVEALSRVDDRYRIDDHSGFAPLDLVDLFRLLLDRVIFVNDTDSALLCQGDSECGFGHCVHRRRTQWDIQFDASRKSRSRVDLTGQYFRICRDE